MTDFKNKGCEATNKANVIEFAKLQNDAKTKIFTEDLDSDAFCALAGLLLNYLDLRVPSVAENIASTIGVGYPFIILKIIQNYDTAFYITL